MRRKFTLVPLLVLTLLASGPALAIEQVPNVTAEFLLGPNITGRKWAVAPTVRSDGIIWIFTVKSSYGDFQVNGLRRMKERMQELRALETLEKCRDQGLRRAPLSAQAWRPSASAGT